MEDIFIKNLPQIDLHGDTRDIAIVKVKYFIEENKLLNNKKIVIIHGKGTGLLKKEVHNYLLSNKDVLNYEIYNFNDGCTIVELK